MKKNISVWIAMLVLVAGMFGCAVKPEPKASTKKTKTAAVQVDQGARELETLRSGLKTKDDSLVLDLLQAFRILRVQAHVEGKDAEEVARGRLAYDELEARLRKGGLKSKGNNERVYSIGNQDNLTLEEVLNVASKSAQKLLLEGDLVKARARNREIVVNRPTLSFAVEDALWGLALADALEAPGMPDVTKRKLRSLHETYVHDAAQDEIVKQVNALLAEVADEKLRQQLKKLANRAWERDRRANRLPQGSKKAAVVDTAPVPLPKDPVASSGNATVTSAVTGAIAAATGITPDAGNANANSRSVAPLAITKSDSDLGGTANTAPVSSGNVEHTRVDSLIGAGRYIPALHALEALDAGTNADFIRERRMRAGERFCDDRRRSAAETYKRARSASVDSIKIQWLRRTEADLDSCLFYFPETSVGAKVRKNREMIDAELKKLQK